MMSLFTPEAEPARPISISIVITIDSCAVSANRHTPSIPAVKPIIRPMSTVRKSPRNRAKNMFFSDAMNAPHRTAKMGVTTRKMMMPSPNPMLELLVSTRIRAISDMSDPRPEAAHVSPKVIVCLGKNLNESANRIPKTIVRPIAKPNCVPASSETAKG